MVGLAALMVKEEMVALWAVTTPATTNRNSKEIQLVSRLHIALLFYRLSYTVYQLPEKVVTETVVLVET